MALNLPIEFPIELCIGFTKDSLEHEIKTGFETGQAIPLAKKFPRSELQIKTKEEATVLKRLNYMYEDPRFGPIYFFYVTKLLRSCLGSYRRARDNPQVYGHYFLCSKVAQGIIIHFNSATRKNQILFLLTKDDGTRQKPVKLGIRTILKWHRNRKVKALKAQLEQIKEMQELRIIARQTREDYVDIASRLFHQEFYTFLKNLEDELLQNKIETRRIAAKKIHLQKAKEGLKQYCEKMIIRHEKYNDFLSLDPGMFEEKDYLKMKIDHYKNLTQFHLNEQANLAHFFKDN